LEEYAGDRPIEKEAKAGSFHGSSLQNVAGITTEEIRLCGK